MARSPRRSRATERRGRPVAGHPAGRHRLPGPAVIPELGHVIEAAAVPVVSWAPMLVPPPCWPAGCCCPSGVPSPRLPAATARDRPDRRSRRAPFVRSHPVLTALVIDASPAARHQVTGLLEPPAGGSTRPGDAEDARWLSAATTPTWSSPPPPAGPSSGAALLRELRLAGEHRPLPGRHPGAHRRASAPRPSPPARWPASPPRSTRACSSTWSAAAPRRAAPSASSTSRTCTTPTWTPSSWTGCRTCTTTRCRPGSPRSTAASGPVTRGPWPTPRTPWPAPPGSWATPRSPQSAGRSPPTPAAGSWPTRWSPGWPGWPAWTVGVPPRTRPPPGRPAGRGSAA